MRMEYQFDGKKYEKTSQCQSEWGNTYFETFRRINVYAEK